MLGDLGWTPRLYHDEVIIDLAPAGEVRSALELGTVVPAIRVWRTIYASRGDGEPVPVDLTEILLAGDRHVLDYHMAVAGPQAALGTDG